MKEKTTAGAGAGTPRQAAVARSRPATTRTHDPGCRTLRRGLDLLELLKGAGLEGLRIADICRAMELERAPVYRLLHTLAEAGYVQKLGRFHYVASARAGEPPPGVGSHAIAARMQPVLQRISARLGDAAFLVVREAHISHCIARQLGTHPVQVLPISIGNRQPLGVGAAGLALLAALPDDEVQRVVAQSVSLLQSYGGMSPERLALLVRATRERGRAVVANHATYGVLGVGVAVRSRRGLPVAAVSVASTIERMPRERQKLVAATISDVLNTSFRDGFA